jgi:site-specific DNA-adenine methylase
MLTPMVILLMMISLSSCKLNSKVDFNQTVGRSPAFSDETKEKAIAACTKMKQNEHAWKAKDIKAYCKEHWRGYIDFIEGDKDGSTDV